MKKGNMLIAALLFCVIVIYFSPVISSSQTLASRDIYIFFNPRRHLLNVESLIWLSGNLQLNTLMKLLAILDSRLRGNDTFLQSVPSLSVIPAKAGIQELIDNLSIVDKQKIVLVFHPL